MKQIAGGGVVVLLGLLTVGCATAPRSTPPPAPAGQADELDELLSTLSRDADRASARSLAPRRSTPAQQRERAAAERQWILAKEDMLRRLVMPVAHLSPRDIRDSWGAPRDGGKRPHRGIDIFAPRGTEIVAVADGLISYIGNQPKGGRCLWLITDQGVSFYYAHLDRWAPGLYEGMEVKQGDTLGYVGNTGNALSTPPHLHFSVLDGEEALNPFPILTKSMRSTPRPLLGGGLTAAGGR